MTRLVPALIAAAVFASAQQPSQQAVGIFNSISNHATRLAPMLEQVRAKDWIAKGAPDTYDSQLASARRHIQTIQAQMADMVKQPEEIQKGMLALFEVQAFHRVLDSLMGGLRRYQNPALADLIQAVSAEDQADLERLQQHLVNLVGEKEEQYRVIDHEAQRCRAILSAQPPPAPARTTKK